MADLLRQIFDAITQWPVIAQGVAGSALFAVLSYVGQKLAKNALSSLSKLNQNLRKENLYRELIHRKHLREAGRLNSVLLVSIYQAFGYLARGLIFLALGWFFEGVVPLSLKVGALGFLFYAFRAVLWIDSFTVESKESDLQVWRRIRDVEIEMNGAADEDTLAKLKELEP